jgi:hypothetical protein
MAVRITDPSFTIARTRRAGRQEAVLLTALEYRVGSAESDEVIVVPAGFITDFASVPKGLWNIFPPFGEWAAAAVVHDYLYKTQGLNGKYDRKQADKIFKEAMEVLEVPKWKRELMYNAVRTFGKGGWGS